MIVNREQPYLTDPVESSFRCDNLIYCELDTPALWWAVRRRPGLQDALFAVCTLPRRGRKSQSV